MIKRPFEQWLFEDVELTFGIDRDKQMPALKKYNVSRAYDATQTDDMSAMIIILNRVQQYIQKEVGLSVKS